MKKTLTALLLAALLLASLPVSALAHSHGGGTKNTLCTAKNCNTVGNHWHNGTCYAGHTLNDGHTYHKLCNVKTCTRTYCHNHDGVTYLPHASNDGHSYHGHGGGRCH